MLQKAAGEWRFDILCIWHDDDVLNFYCELCHLITQKSVNMTTKIHLTINAKYAIGAIALLYLSGCAYFDGKYTHEEPIGTKRIDMIKLEKTSIREVLTWLGPPIAVARRGQVITCPNIGADACSHEIQPDGFFELFSSNRMLKENEVVYYYQASRMTTSGFFFILILINGGGVADRNRAEQLWLLVNDETGLIEDFVYRPG